MATFSGAVGADLEGKNLSRRLKRSGLNCLLDVKTEHRTGKTVSLVTKNGKFQNKLHKFLSQEMRKQKFSVREYELKVA